MQTDFPSIIFDVLLLKNLLAWKIYAMLKTMRFGNLVSAVCVFFLLFSSVAPAIARLGDSNILIHQHFYSSNSLYFQLSFYT